MPYTPPFRTRRSPQRLAEPHLGESDPGDDALKKPLTWTTASAQPLADDPTRATAPAPDDDDDALPVLTQLVEPPVVTPPPVMPPVIAPPVVPPVVSPAAAPPVAPLAARPVAPIASAASLQPAAPPPPVAPTPPAPARPAASTLPAASAQPMEEPEDEDEDKPFAARQGVDEELVARITDEVLDALQPILHDLVGDAVRRALSDHIRQGGML